MREKLQSLPLTTLRDLARDKNVKGAGTLKKAELIEAIIATASMEESADNSKKEIPKNNEPQVKDDPLKQEYDPEMVDNSG